MILEGAQLCPTTPKLVLVLSLVLHLLFLGQSLALPKPWRPALTVLMHPLHPVLALVPVPVAAFLERQP